MYLMLDVVVNQYVALTTQIHQPIVLHSFVGIPRNTSDGYQTLDFSLLQPFSDEYKYHPYCQISDYANQTQVEQCWLGDQTLPLADLDTEDAYVVKTMNEWIGGLVGAFSADGLRIDTAKHVRKDFWPAFVEAAGTFSMGEV